MNWTALLAGIRVCPGVLAATGTFIETTFPMRHKPRVIPGIENVAAWPDGEHALIEREAERDVAEPSDIGRIASEGLADALGVRAHLFGPYEAHEVYADEPPLRQQVARHRADEFHAREAQVRAGGFGGINGMPPTTTCADVAAALQNIPQGPPPPGEPQLTDDELVAVRQLIEERFPLTDALAAQAIAAINAAIREGARNAGTPMDPATAEMFGIKTPAAPVPDADAAAEGRPAPTPPKSPVGAGQPERPRRRPCKRCGCLYGTHTPVCPLKFK